MRETIKIILVTVGILLALGIMSLSALNNDWTGIIFGGISALGITIALNLKEKGYK